MDFLSLFKPPLPTPPDEICRCSTSTPVKLMCALSENPIACLDCNREVDPARLPLTLDIAQSIAFYRNQYDAIDRLWLASGEYEEWARNQLADIHSEINRIGLAARADLDAVHRCYYWYFQDHSVDDFVPAENCPLCGAAFASYGSGDYSLCEHCSIVAVA